METIDGFDEERIDNIGPNGNEGLHYEKEVSELITVRLDDITKIEEVREMFMIIFTVLNRSVDIVTELSAESDYFDAYPNLKAIAKADHGKDITT